MGFLLKTGWYKLKGVAAHNRPPVHPFTLSFIPAGLNQEFDEYATRHSLSFARLSLSLAIILYISFSWLEAYIFPEATSLLVYIRIVSCLMFIGAIYLTYTEWGIKNYQLVMSVLFVLASLGIIIITLIWEFAGEVHYYAGLILAIVYAHSLLRMRFIYASLTTWLVITVYIASTIITGTTPFEVYMNNSYFLIAANIMGMFASFWLEFYMKAGFWNQRILNEKSEELQKESLRKSRELEAARIMQINMLPRQFPYSIDYQFSFSMSLASEVGGDFYDYQMEDDGVLTFGIGDATGHGLQASVMVTAIKLLFSEHAAKNDIIEFLHRASHTLSLMDFRKIYMAFAIGRLRNNTLELAGAGMPSAMIYRKNKRIVEQVYLKGMPLGTHNFYPYTKTVIDLEPGDAVLLMSDGLPELFNSKGEMFGYERVEQTFTDIAHLHPESVIQHLIGYSKTWLDSKSQDDDMTFFVFRRKAEVTTRLPADDMRIKTSDQPLLL